jgi:competence protein ComEC
MYVLFSALALVGILLALVVLRPDAGLRVTFFDVGQGDSILIQTPTGQTMLIDGGPDRSILADLGRALPFYSRQIEIVVLTHPHADHVIGLNEVLQRYDVSTIVYADIEYDAPEYTAWQEMVRDSGATVIAPRRGLRLQLGEATFTILHPLDDIAGQYYDDANDSSVVGRLEYHDVSFLFTGDAPVAIEEKLLVEYPDTLDSDVLKVGHHGSRYSSSVDFLRAVSPQFAVIQSGAGNSFGHPHELVLRRLGSVGTEVLRTDEQGDIRFESDGKRVVQVTT